MTRNVSHSKMKDSKMEHPGRANLRQVCQQTPFYAPYRSTVKQWIKQLRIDHVSSTQAIHPLLEDIGMYFVYC